MGVFAKFVSESCKKIWEGFLQNLGVLVWAFVFSGGYIIAINKIQKFQIWVRSIPTDYILTPFLLFIIAFLVLVRVLFKQRIRLSKLEREPHKNDGTSRFVTHLGVWWRIYPDAEYIEDFPYCPCCEPRLKLVQVEWHPDEVFKCSKTGTDYKLFDNVPQRKEDILNMLYSTYFSGIGSRFSRLFHEERDRLKRLSPDMSDQELANRLFDLDPLCNLPKSEREEILQRFPNPFRALQFIEDHFSIYKMHFKAKQDGKS
jgi:hypothetical protein